MVADLTLRLTTDGHNERAQCQSHFASFQKDTLTFFYFTDILRGDFPLQRLLSSANHNQRNDWDLIRRHSFPARFG